jgi:hypothetical protein
MSSSLVANDDVTVEAKARLPMWFARNVRQVCDGVVSRWGRYRDTVRSETVNPSFSTCVLAPMTIRPGEGGAWAFEAVPRDLRIYTSGSQSLAPRHEKLRCSICTYVTDGPYYGGRWHGHTPQCSRLH